MVDDHLVGEGGAVAQFVARAGAAAANAVPPYGLTDCTIGASVRLDASRTSHWHQRRRAVRTLRVAVTVAVLVLAVSVPLLVRAHGTPTVDFQQSAALLPSQGSLDKSVLLAVVSESDLLIISASTGTSRSESQAAIARADYPLLATGNGVVGVDAGPGESSVGTAVALSPTYASSPVTLGRASYVVDGFMPGEVWLVVSPHVPQVSGKSPCDVEEVKLSGQVLVKPTGFPCSWTVEGAAPEGLLVARSEVEATPSSGLFATLSVWDPANNRITASFGYQANLQVDGDTGTTAIWNNCSNFVARASCPDRVTNLATSQTSVLPELPRGWTASSNYVLSSNGYYAAVVAVPATVATQLFAGSPDDFAVPTGSRDLRPVGSALFIYNLRTDSLVEARSLTVAAMPAIEWSLDTGYVFISQDPTHVAAVPAWSDSAPIRSISVPNSYGMSSALAPAAGFAAVGTSG
jgi:hypothetical protein